MNNPLAFLFNRAPKPSAGLSLPAEKEKTAKAPASDPLRSLTADWIETNYRLEVNKGLFAKPAWAFHELSRTCSMLGDKVRFWKAHIAALEWHIAVAKDAQEGAKDADPAKVAKAEKQRKALLDAYEKIENLKAALKHLASARFYGFAALRKSGNQLQIVDPWNVIHDIQWLNNAAPSMKWHFNDQALASLDKTGMPEMKPAEYIIRECEDPSLLELMRLAYRANRVMDFRERNLEEASKNQVIILTGANVPEVGTPERTALESALNQARKGESAVIAKGDPNCPTEVHKMDASKGLPFYTTTLENIDQAMTKAVTGGMLTMLSMPTGIGSGASETQSATLQTLVADEAGDISEAMQKGFDRFVLEKANLLATGERPLAWFELSSRKEVDPKGNAEVLAAVKAVGFEVEEEQAAEMLGMPVKRTLAAPMGGAAEDINADPNAEEAEDDEDPPNRDATDAGFFSLLDRLSREMGGDGTPTDEWFTKLEAAIQNAPPDAMMDTAKLEAFLRERMDAARQKGMEDGAKGA